MILVNRTLLCSKNIHKTFSLCVLNKINQQFRNIMSWEQKKANFLTMKTEDKCKDFIKLETIKTWGEHAKSAKLGAKLDVKPEHSINASKNKILVNKISIFEGDITKLEVDSIVNAANSSLMGGGGVDGAIHRAAGKSLQDECKTLGGCPEGEARITGGYNLPSKYVIHTVGPKGEKTKILENCYKHSLDLMLKNKLRSIAFPCIATGIYGYPNDAACYVAVNEVRKFLETNSDNVDRVIFCLFMDVDKAVYGKVLQSYFPLE